jgi:uncharacterized protein (TIGR00725 family)
VAARRTIAVVGPNDADDELCRLAYELGELLAGRGDVTMTGGLGGVMEAASRGAREGGGVVVGILPGTDATAANEAVSVAVPTGLGELRNGLIVRAADGVIAVGGSWGTLSEIALAMRTETPIVCVRGWHLSDHGDKRVILPSATNAAEAIDVLYSAIHAREASENASKR